jgi:hypothetical protein
MVTGPAQGRPGVAGARGKLGVFQVSPQTNELGSHRTALEIECPALPQFKHACLQRLAGKEGRSPRPQTGCGRVRAAKQAAGHVKELARVAVLSLQRSP